LEHDGMTFNHLDRSSALKLSTPKISTFLWQWSMAICCTLYSKDAWTSE